MPRRFVDFVGARLGDLFYYANAKRRRVAYINISLCFPELSEEQRGELVRKHFRVYAQSMLDLGLLWWASERALDRYIKVVGLEHYREPYERGRRIIVLTGHYAALEIGGVILSRYFPQVGLIKPEKNAVVDWFITRGRMRFQARLFRREQGLRPVVRAIKQGMAFYYLPDEDFGPAKSIFVPFLGTQAATITALGRLVKLCNAVVIPCHTHRLSRGRGYVITLRSAIPDFSSGRPEAGALRMNQELEKSIRKAPEQYMWTFKYFKTRPSGEPSPYD